MSANRTFMIRPEFEGMRIDPCPPAVWGGFSAVRKFRGRTFDIKVYNPQHVYRGVVDVRLDGERRQGAIIPPDLPGERHTVELWLGHPQCEECTRQPAIGATEADPRETWRHGCRARRG